MVSLKIQLLATILFLSEAYSQLASCGGSSQRCGPASPTIMPCGQFIVPAMIKPLIPSCQPAAPAQPATSAPKKQTPGCDVDDDRDLDKLLYLLISNIIENKKCSGKKQSTVSSVSDSYTSSSACASDGYDACAFAYSDDYDYSSYSSPVVYSSGSDSSCPEISVFIRPYEC